MRSEPLGWRGSVSTARPPTAAIAAAISRSAQATTTGPTPAATARRQTWTTIGSPAISASGLPGSRVEARREGMIRIGFAGAVLVTSFPWAIRQGRPATRCPLRRLAGSLIIHLNWQGESDFLPGRSGSAAPSRGCSGGRAGNPTEWKVVDAILRVEQDHCVGSDRHYRRTGRGDPRRHAGATEGAGETGLRGPGAAKDRGDRGGAGQGRAAADRAAARQGRSAERQTGGSGLHRLPYLREGSAEHDRPQSVEHRQQRDGRGSRRLRLF